MIVMGRKNRKYTASDWSIPERLATGKTLCMVVVILAAILTVFLNASLLKKAAGTGDSIYLLEDGKPVRADRNPEVTGWASSTEEPEKEVMPESAKDQEAPETEGNIELF